MARDSARPTIRNYLKGGQEQMLPVDDDKRANERRYALEMLDSVRKRQHEIRYHKLYYARVAREHGATYAEIADALGVTAPAVYKMLRLAGEEAVA